MYPKALAALYGPGLLAFKEAHFLSRKVWGADAFCGLLQPKSRTLSVNSLRVILLVNHEQLFSFH
jgi:hypothetical protein